MVNQIVTSDDEGFARDSVIEQCEVKSRNHVIEGGIVVRRRLQL